MHIRIFRHLAVIFCVLLPSPILSLAQDDQNEQSDTSVPVHETLELAFTSAELPENPFDTYLLRLELTDPAGRTFKMDGFYDGDGDGGQDGNVWKARITPDVPGEWAWRTIPGDDDVVDPELEGLSGSFEATPSDHNGPIVAEGRHFRYKDGDYVYLIGNFLDFRNGLRSTHTFTSETTTDEMRDAIFEAQVDFHGVNKVNLYLANKDDYSSQSVTPWVGTAEDNDKTQMDLARWALYDEYVRRFGERDIVTEMWFLADDSDFGSLSSAEIERLLRYGMARLSAFSYTMFVFSLEWQEAFSADEVREYGAYLAAHNPWERLISVHTLELTP
ncbi:MAG: DUF5060 domain-containing protein, partial [Anaerolineae bacterium]|nr:DUF5060 domain-containing protein [Anaerolineae bacterium]